MTTASKNYTDEMVARLATVYQPLATEPERVAQVAALAVELGRSVRSIIAKLDSMGMYIPKVAVPKGKASVTKATMVAQLEEVTGFDFEGLEAATKSNLENLLYAFSSLVNDEVEEVAEVSDN